MSDNYNISYSYSVDGTPPKPAEDTRLFAFDDCEEVPLPNGTVLLVAHSRSRQTVVSRDVSTALNYCREFRTLSGHAKFLADYMPELGGDVGPIRSVLASVQTAGVLVEASEFSALLNPVDETPTPAPSQVFVITCDRPEAVSRLLETLLAGADLGRHRGLTLIDDSRDQDCTAQNRELVAQFNTRSPLDMRYFGDAERAQLITELVQKAPEHEQALRFLVDRERWSGHKTYGQSRTLCLLLSVGYRAVVLDDDVICSAINPPARSEGIGFNSGMSDVAFYRSQDAWLNNAMSRDEDPLVGHLQCLGLGLGSALGALQMSEADRCRLGKSQLAIMNNITQKSRVLVTQNGTYGDPGTGDTAWCFNLTGASLQRLLDGPESIEAKYSNRQYWMGWTKPTFSNQANMSQVTGLDNSTLLPPYFPAWRGEDQLFGVMVRFLHPDSLVLNYPWAVPHMPLESRTGSITTTPESAGGAALVETHISEHIPDNPALSLQERQAALVALFRGMARRGDGELAAAYRAGLASDQANSARQVADLLRSAPESHAEWRALLNTRGRAFMEALARNEVPVQISGVPAEMPEAQLWNGFRHLADEFATALAAWPALRTAAEEVAATQRSRH